MEAWCGKHETFQRETSEGLKWVVRTLDRETGRSWLFRFAYDERPGVDVLTNLDAGRRCDPVLDRYLNYVWDDLRPLRAWRPTTRKTAWLIAAEFE